MRIPHIDREVMSFYVDNLAGRSISSTVLTGDNPTHVDTTNPITLFIIQLFIIIAFTQGLGFILGFLKQPKVIAEVIGGIILGPTVMGRIPGFTDAIFPQASITYLNLVSMIGLILFLFLVGLEVDIGIMKRNGRNSAIISLAGMILPFGLGAAIAVPIYNKFVDTANVSFGHFLLFVGVAIAITAFPVLCRILSSLKLLDTRVGVIVLAAGVGNDVVGWALLALTLALVNAKAGQTAVYVLLCAVAWTIILLWPIKKAFRWCAYRSGSMDGHGPTPGMMLLTLMIVFASAFVTGIIGVHPIFGGFIAGLIIPHEGGFAIHLVEKIDDLVSLLFLPIYFVLSGLSTNLGLLNDGEAWGYIVLICVIAWAGKFFGCAGTAWLLGYSKRESGAIGMLMSCKGLVELIVLNVGLQANIINQKLFSMFVLHAIVLTFITTPGTLLIYPEKHRKRISSEVDDKADGKKTKSVGTGITSGGAGGREYTSKFLVVLQKIEHLSAVMLLSQMLEPSSVVKRRAPTVSSSGSAKVIDKLDTDTSDESEHSSPSHGHVALPTLSEDNTQSFQGIHMDALKLIELTGRTFSVMQSAEKDQLLLTDDTLQLYKQFGRLRGLDVTPHITIVDLDSYPASVAEHAQGLGSELVILPWTIPVISESTALIDTNPTTAEKEGLPGSSTTSPYETIFGGDTSGSPMYTHFLRKVFAESPSDVALFVDRGFGGSASFSPGSGQHIYLPFFGGPDDRLALRFVVQLCQHKNVSATIVRIERDGDGSPETNYESGKSLELSDSVAAHQVALQQNQLTVGPNQTTFPVNKIASETADNLAWNYLTAPTSSRSSFTESAIKRISFISNKSSTPLSQTIELAESSALHDGAIPQWRSLMIVTGRSRRGSPINHTSELNKILADKGQNPNIGAELRKTVGDVATGLMLGGGGKSSGASFLVLEAGMGKSIA